MKAVVQDSYGGPAFLRVEDVARPRPDKGEVLVRVKAASVHADVWHVVAGWPFILRLMGAGFSRPKNPIPGTDMAGIVEEVGDGVGELEPGDEVFGETITGQQWTNGGAYAEYVSVASDQLARKPPNVSFEQAASTPTSGFIALSNLPERDQFDRGLEVLVNGAGGGTGSLALQIAKAWGAHVTAVDSAEKLDMLKRLGADRVIDYQRQNITRGEQRYDFIFDVPGNYTFSEFRRILEPDGRYVPIGYDDYGKSGRNVFGLIPYFMTLMVRSRFHKQLGSGRRAVPSRREVMATLRELLAAGKITPVIDSTFALDEVQQAFRRLIEGRPQGRVILTA